jgi:NAD(P)-dependent dehydrogenase (short-subunit alcohol dehydrogenase family)
MDLRLQGKRALVTGGSGSIGAEIARTFAREGATVAVQGRDEARAKRVAGEIEAASGKAFVVLGDLTMDDSVCGIVEETLSVLGGVDILINNASSFSGVHTEEGYYLPGWMDSPPEKWRDMFNHNVFPMVRLIQLLVPQMKELGWGRFIQIGSSAGLQPAPLGPEYSASKAVISNLSVSLSKELANTGITANTISPGPILTDGWRRVARKCGWGEEDAEIERNMMKAVFPNPTGRIGRVEEVASLVALVASPLGGFINGANLRIDGGFVVGI